VGAGVTTPPEPALETELEEAKPASPRRRRLLRRLVPELTPEQKVEAERLSGLAAKSGTDPTAIIGRVQTSYRYDALPGGTRLNNLVGRVDLPFRSNWVLRVDVPNLWLDGNRPRVGNRDGLGDTFVRAGGRFYQVPGYAFFGALDFMFPTAASSELGLGKFTIAPGAATARVLPDLHSLAFAVFQHQMSIGGDPSRKDVSLSRLALTVNTIWGSQWWSSVEAVTQVDWWRKARSSLTLEFEGGHRFTQDWGAWVRPGIGLVGRDVVAAYEWNVEFGIRRTFSSF
jgi:hypothetical protein